jgi:hypothetical protein
VDGQEGTSYIVTADSSFMLNDAEQDGGCADLDGTVAVIYAVDMSDNNAYINGGCLNVLDDTVTLRQSNFDGNRATKLGKDIFIYVDKETFVKCNAKCCLL